MPFCKVKGVEISYQESGQKSSSQKNIVFIHGAGGNAGRWISQVEQIGQEHPEDYYVVAPDLPGHGQSGGEACGQIFLYREWVKEITEAMGLNNLVIVGHSMGGAIALDFALKYPQLTTALVIVSSGPRFEIDPERLEAYKRGEYTREWARASFAHSAPEHLVEKIFQEAHQSDPWARYLDFLACSRFHAEGLHNISAPTSIICGVEDINTPPQLSEYMAENIKEVSLNIIEDAAHQVMLEQPDVVTKLIINFIKDLQPL